MIEFLVHLFATTVFLVIVTDLFDNIEADSLGSVVFAAFVLGLVNALINPIVQFLMLPITIITLGLFYFVVNGLMLQLAAAVVPGFRVKTLGTAILAGLIISLLNWFFVAVFGG